MVANSLSALFTFWKFSLKAALSFRGVFLISGLSMAITNMILFLPIWYLSLVNDGLGGIPHVLIVQGIAISLISFFIGINFTVGVQDLQEIIINGELDKYLLRPIGLYKNILIHRMNPWMLGELIGSIVLLLFNDISTWPFIIFASIVGGILFNHIMLLFNLTPFFFPQEREQGLWETSITTSIYPPSMFNDVGKFVALYIIPGAMTSYGLIYAKINPQFLWIYVPFYLFIIIMTHVLLHIGIKKYSGAGY